MNELVEPLAAQAGANGALAVDALPKVAAAKRKKKAEAKTATENLATMIAIVLRDPADDIQILIDRIPSAKATVGAPMRHCVRAAPRGDLIAPKGKSTEPELSRRGLRSMPGELFKFGGDRAGADPMG